MYEDKNIQIGDHRLELVSFKEGSFRCTECNLKSKYIERFCGVICT